MMSLCDVITGLVSGLTTPWPMVLSPNRGSRKGRTVTGIVLHYTRGPTARSAYLWFQNPASKASTHFVVDTDGTVTQCVPLSESAWHVGDAVIGNRSTIGIEIANVGPLVESGGSYWYTTGGKRYRYTGPTPKRATLVFSDGQRFGGWWAPYPAAQISAVVALLRELERRGYPLDLYGHEDIRVELGSKTDPGPLFPWHLMPGRRVRPRTSVEA